MKVLITGANGQLARQLVHTVPSGNEVRAVNHAECDITEYVIVERILKSFRPDVVINTAAYTKVDEAEKNPGLAFGVNARGAENVAKAASLMGSRLIHISTDYVFDGQRSTPYPPEEPAHPVNVYGASKLAGEEGVLDEAPNTLIIRSSWLYSTRGKNFLHTVLDLLRTGTCPKMVTDQRGSPTLAADLADVIWLCSEREDLRGTYHFANTGDASWFEFACEIRELLLVEGTAMRVPEITPITSAEYNATAVRPRYSVLDSGALLRVLSRSARSWRAALRQAFDEVSRKEAS